MERRSARTSAGDHVQESSLPPQDPAREMVQAHVALVRLGASSRWTTAVWAATTVVAAVLVTGYTFRPPAALGPAADAGPQLNPSVSLPLVVEDVDSCSSVMQDRQVRGGQTSSPAASGTDAATSQDGPVLPSLELPCLTAGTAVDPARLSGRPTVVNLWASWCTPCREEMPMLQQAQARTQGRVQFLGVTTKDRPDWAAEFLEEVGVSYPEVVDADGQLLAAVRSPGLPVTIVLDRDGRVAGQQVGRVSQQQLDALLAEAGA